MSRIIYKKLNANYKLIFRKFAKEIKVCIFVIVIFVIFCYCCCSCYFDYFFIIIVVIIVIIIVVIKIGWQDNAVREQSTSYQSKYPCHSKLTNRQKEEKEKNTRIQKLRKQH